MPKNTKSTSSKVAKKAGSVLQKDDSSKVAKTLAASVLSQKGNGKETSAKVEKLASLVLKSSDYDEDIKKLAASALSQSNKERK